MERPDVRTHRVRPPAENFAIALAHHNGGRLSEAEPYYRMVLDAEPDHFEALNNLGLLLARQGKSAEAIALTRKAIALNRHNALSHGNLGRMLSLSGRHEETRWGNSVRPSRSSRTTFQYLRRLSPNCVH